MKFNIADYFTQMPPANIIRVEALKNYCRIYFKNNQNTLVVSITLMRVQERLPAEMFVRVHRSHLVNKLYIKRMKRQPDRQVEMTNGEYVPISRRKAVLVAMQ
jgi:two-component system, LytTR family, response regulator